MKQALESDRLELSGYSGQRFESRDGDFSEDVLFQMTNLPLASHAATNQTRRLEMMGEFVLVQAILREAIRTYQKFALKKGNRAARLFREVDEWFSAEDRQWFFSFVNVCDVLGLEPTYIRTGLKLWRERKLQAAASASVQGVQRMPRRLRGNMAAAGLAG
jgi:hypothetical protein